MSTRPSTAADKGLGGFGATLGGFKLGEKVGYNIGWEQHRMGTRLGEKLGATYDLAKHRIGTAWAQHRVDRTFGATRD